MEDIKIVVVGDSGVGKTSLLMKYNNWDMPKVSTSAFMLYPTKKIINGKQIQLDLYDIDVKEKFDTRDYRISSYDYPKIADVVLICFSLKSLTSFTNVSKKWIPEVKKYCPNVPIILVGTHHDVPDQDREVKLETTQTMSKVDICEYFCCASIPDKSESDHIAIIFDTVCKLVLDKRNPPIVRINGLDS